MKTEDFLPVYSQPKLDTLDRKALDKLTPEEAKSYLDSLLEGYEGEGIYLGERSDATVGSSSSAVLEESKNVWFTISSHIPSERTRSTRGVFSFKVTMEGPILGSETTKIQDFTATSSPNGEISLSWLEKPSETSESTEFISRELKLRVAPSLTLHLDSPNKGVGIDGYELYQPFLEAASHSNELPLELFAYLQNRIEVLVKLWRVKALYAYAKLYNSQ